MKGEDVSMAYDALLDCVLKLDLIKRNFDELERIARKYTLNENAISNALMHVKNQLGLFVDFGNSEQRPDLLYTDFADSLRLAEKSNASLEARA